MPRKAHAMEMSNLVSQIRYARDSKDCDVTCTHRGFKVTYNNPRYDYSRVIVVSYEEVEASKLSVIGMAADNAVNGVNKCIKLYLEEELQKL